MLSLRPVASSVRRPFWFLLLGTSFFLQACASTVQPASLTAFSQAAAATNKQADLAFVESNKLARDVSAARFIRSGRPGLTEAAFLVAVSAEDIASWQAALSGLEDYGAALATLVDSKRGSRTSDAIVGLGHELQSGVIGAKINPSVATGFAALGGALVDAKAQASAREILQQADPHVQHILHAMANAVGENNTEGLRGTVASAWAASFRPLQEDYAQAATGRRLADQQRLVSEFQDLLDRRDAQLRSLASLRSSLLALAASHGAAAAGDPLTMSSLLAQVDARLDETKRLYDAFTEAESGKGNGK